MARRGLSRSFFRFAPPEPKVMVQWLPLNDAGFLGKRGRVVPAVQSHEREASSAQGWQAIASGCGRRDVTGACTRMKN
jgi:hypothetical protein